MRSICVSLGFNESQGFTRQRENDSASLEYMRAFAGVYYLLTMTFTTNKTPDAFMGTNYVAQCCRVLEENMEFPTDKIAALLLRTQQISQSISMALTFRDSVNGLPLTILVNTFEREIEQLRRSMPESLQDHGQCRAVCQSPQSGLIWCSTMQSALLVKCTSPRFFSTKPQSTETRRQVSSPQNVSSFFGSVSERRTRC